MADFSEIVYRGQGLHQRKGGGFSTLGVNSPEALEKALADGWYRTLPEANEAHDKPKSVQSAAPASASVPQDDAPPTRAELEQKAKELGVKFDGRTSDRKLGEAIAKALG